MTTSSDKNQEQKQIIRLSISEAARLFGVNSQTVRRALANQEFTYVVVGGRYKLNFESLVKWSQKHATVRNKTEKRGIGQYIEKWKIKNPLFSPNPRAIKSQPATDDATKEKTAQQDPLETQPKNEDEQAA
jgi:excisionase family DNA binding protein